MISTEYLTISVRGVRHEGALLQGAGGVCETRARAAKWLRRKASRGQTCIVHLNYTNKGSEQFEAAAADITIHEAGAPPLLSQTP